MADSYASTDDRRTENNSAEADQRLAARSTLRHEYRVLTDDEKLSVRTIKETGQHFLDFVDSCAASHGSSRELSLARTKLEEAVMWAVKGITK